MTLVTFDHLKFTGRGGATGTVVTGRRSSVTGVLVVVLSTLLLLLNFGLIFEPEFLFF